MIRLAAHAPRWRLPLVLAALLAVLLLAGCGGSASGGPLVAARVNGDGISLSDYQDMLAWYEASATLPDASGQPGAPIVWQAPNGRPRLAQAQQAALSLLINLQLMRQQLHTLHIAVAPASIAAVRAQWEAAIKDVQSRKDPVFAPVIAALTPHALDILSEQGADQQALIAHIQVPTVHVRVILVNDGKLANDLKGQLEHGADFAQLAKQNSQDAQTAQAGGEYGTVYIGQFDPQFDAQVFAKTPAKYVIVPIGQEYALLEVTQPANKPLSALGSPQSEQAVFDAWLAIKVRAAASIQTDVAIV